jgi:hypothetical protein
MRKYEIICPSDQELLEYVCDRLDFEEVLSMEEHLYSCSSCIENVRKLSFASDLYLTTKAHPIHGTLWDALQSDSVTFAAASSESEAGISEIQSKDGKYILRLIPFLDENKSILEIKSTNESANGILTVENPEGILFKSSMINGIAHQEIQNNVDLKYLIITFEKAD